MIFGKFNSSKKNISLMVAPFFILIAGLSGTQESWAISSKIRITVNGMVITDVDVSKRAETLRQGIQNENLNKMAEEQLITEALQLQEIDRHGMSVSSDTIDAYFANKANGLGMTKEEFAKSLESEGFEEKHWRNLITLQLTWPHLVYSTFMSNIQEKNYQEKFMDFVRERKGKATIREYTVQKVIFIVPHKELNNNNALIKRQKEAEDSRSHFPGCEKSEEFASTMHDVYISNVLRLHEPDLDPQLINMLRKAHKGTTDTYISKNGIEYYSICSTREINGEIALRAIFNAQNLRQKFEKNFEKYSREYIKKLRSSANIHFYQ
ncbi:SurA N-terminal domain-containing protein [Candidatus Liberibacter sp.]|uniref:SurA N-terminal domain-containing protein n=1 Tax=Candidatus Liberibacter sp. TaxID=34022 RepID=UPI0015F6E468|nr:SurA N-terminal domain-containing protein [Candidatus Liberibacter sp.]MBA5724226.1 SurA N-terminal domain-containing protein [Candidatus Liberibacter sp.]